MQYVTTQGISFDIITTDEEIIFLDEYGDSLTWDRTDVNQGLVSVMVTELINKVIL